MEQDHTMSLMTRMNLNSGFLSWSNMLTFALHQPIYGDLIGPVLLWCKLIDVSSILHPKKSIPEKYT